MKIFNIFEIFMHGVLSQEWEVGFGSKVWFSAFKVLDPSGCGKIHSKELIEALTCEASRFSKEEIDALMDFAPVDVSGYLDYKALCYIITHGQEEE